LRALRLKGQVKTNDKNKRKKEKKTKKLVKNDEL
jgi:hypothetical protein